MKLLYNKGYLIRIVSWENDGDNYNTKEITTQSKELAIAYGKLCKLFNTSSDLANIYEPCDDEYKTIADALVSFYREHESIFAIDLSDIPSDSSEEEIITDCMLEVLYDLGLSGTDFTTRVCAQVKVMYIPQDVYIEEVEF